MLTVREALDAILTAVSPGPLIEQALGECLGLVLVEDVRADLDSPPFDKALMDGYAVRVEDLRLGGVTLAVIEEVTAGHVPQKSLQAGQATRIMTGAPVPEGATAVIPVEQVTAHDAASVRIELANPPRLRSSILGRGASLRAGDTVFRAGQRLRGQELGALAELGRATVRVRPAPTVAVLATGDELVPVGAQPGPGQIRNSNETMLVAQVTQAGGRPAPLGIARDTKESLRERLSDALRHDLLLLSGGVSAGKLDLVPSVLSELGVEQVFHKVQVKPGQPLWFGRCNREGDAGPCFVFGLPGNPVSSMVCFELFARTALRKRMGDPSPEPQPIPARLTHEFTHAGSRPTYHPAKLEFTPRGPEVSTVPWVGSADLCATVAANAMAVFPAGDAVHAAGTMLEVIAW
jgi:molybdopterin molybdotransferase